MQPEDSHVQFIKQVVATGEVWCLDHEEKGAAMSQSEDDEDIAVLPFWSSKALAAAHAKDEWSDYEIVSLDLALFLEQTIIQLSTDDMLVGTNWDENLTGEEINPIELALALIEEIKTTGKQVEFEDHDDMADYEEMTREAAEAVLSE